MQHADQHQRTTMLNLHRLISRHLCSLSAQLLEMQSCYSDWGLRVGQGVCGGADRHNISIIQGNGMQELLKL